MESSNKLLRAVTIAGAVNKWSPFSSRQNPYDDSITALAKVGNIMRHFLPIIIFGVVLMITLNFLKRDREVDAAGNPTVRMWGPCVLFLLVAGFFLWRTLHHLEEPFFQQYRENSYVDAVFVIVGLLAAVWNYYFKITLTPVGIEYRVLFATKLYSLPSVVNVPRNDRGRGGIQLSEGGKIALPSVASGVPYFLKSLAAQVDAKVQSNISPA